MPTIFEDKPLHSSSKSTKTVKSESLPLLRKKSIMTPLTCYAVNPEGVRFETQEEEEKVVLFLRQHYIVNFPWVLLAIILIIAPTVVFPFFLNLIGFSLTVPVGYILVGTVFWYVATFGFVLAKFLGWFFNIYIVTNERVVDIDFYYLLYKNFAEAGLTKIQDISFTSGGIFAAFFNYGDVIVETAGESPNIEFSKVPYPARVIETLRSVIEFSENNP